MKSTQRIVTAEEETTILDLIVKEARALKAGQSDLAATITDQMMRDFAGVLCLRCGHEAYLHSPVICAGGEGKHVCDCPGIKLR
jgi:hypothetical protein